MPIGFSCRCIRMSALCQTDRSLLMKVESAESNAEVPGNTQMDSDVGSIGNPELTDVGKVRYYHDIRASLAIINGYSHALKSSFDELKDQYSDVLEHKDGKSDTVNSDRLMSLEADCRFCLSRLCSSVDQLRERLEIGGVVRDSEQD